MHRSRLAPEPLTSHADTGPNCAARLAAAAARRNGAPERPAQERCAGQSAGPGAAHGLETQRGDSGSRARPPASPRPKANRGAMSRPMRAWAPRVRATCWRVASPGWRRAPGAGGGLVRFCACPGRAAAGRAPWSAGLSGAGNPHGTSRGHARSLTSLPRQTRKRRPAKAREFCTGPRNPAVDAF